MLKFRKVRVSASSRLCCQIEEVCAGPWPLADYPLGRIGSCLRPGMVRGPGPFKEKREKCFFFNSFIISKLLCIVFMLDVHVFVKQHTLVDLVQYIVLVESIFLFLLYNS